MYQTLVIIATRLSRIAGPVCITRLEMRPAKSFWKKFHDCRTTCQWFCQRMRFDRLAAIAWFIRRFCSAIAAGRAISSTSAMPSRMCHDCANSVFGSLALTSDTTRAHEHRNQNVEQRDGKTGGEQGDEQSLRLTRIVPIEREQRCGRLRFVGLTVGFSSRSKNENIRVSTRAIGSPHPAWPDSGYERMGVARGNSHTHEA